MGHEPCGPLDFGQSRSTNWLFLPGPLGPRRLRGLRAPKVESSSRSYLWPSRGPLDSAPPAGGRRVRRRPRRWAARWASTAARAARSAARSAIGVMMLQTARSTYQPATTMCSRAAQPRMCARCAGGGRGVRNPDGLRVRSRVRQRGRRGADMRARGRPRTRRRARMTSPGSRCPRPGQIFDRDLRRRARITRPTKRPSTPAREAKVTPGPALRCAEAAQPPSLTLACACASDPVPTTLQPL